MYAFSRDKSLIVILNTGTLSIQCNDKRQISFHGKQEADQYTIILNTYNNII